MHIRKLFRFGRSRSRTPALEDSRDPSHVSSSHAPSAAHVSSSRASLSFEPPRHDNHSVTPPSDIVLDGSTTQPDHASLPVTTRAISEDPHLTTIPNLSAFSGAYNRIATVITVSGIDINYIGGGSSNFMEKLLEKTILGASFDSSDRDPPPRCHPGTRLAILERCVTFVLNCRNERKMRWVVGAAGVGKSAIMQSVAERPLPPVTLCASIFFFVHGRSDGSKAIITLAYQLAVECEPYRLFIEFTFARDPSLLQKAMSVQFKKLIVEPFTLHPPLKSIGRVLIIIDGLDECDSQRTQEELLRLISDVCITSPSSPFVWLIASRPEPHITSFFAQSAIELAYEREEIVVDSDEARQDVERFLRSELSKVQTKFSLNPRVRWPSDEDFWKLTKASGGLFVYAQTVAKYIGDSHTGNPKSQLDDVLKVIDAHPLLHVSREHPMALLDALYAQILSKVPLESKSNMRKLLLALATFWKVICQEDYADNFIMLCNWLGITPDDAYAALRHLFSVLKVPRRDEAHKEGLEYFHKSFIDYVRDFARSGFSHDIEKEAQQLNTECAMRVLKQSPDNIHLGGVKAGVWSSTEIGRLVDGIGSGCDIALTWSADDDADWDDNRTRVYMYKSAIASIVEGLRNQQRAFYNLFCIRLLATCFKSYSYGRVEHLHHVVFDKSHCHEFMEQGLVRRVPLKALNFSDVTWSTELRFNRSMISSINLPDPWNPSCDHNREGNWGDNEPKIWTTKFDMEHDDDWCDFCTQRLKRQLENWQTKAPDHPVLVLFTSAGRCFVEFKFVDEEDGVSEWTYWLVHKFTEHKRKELGSIV